MFSPTTRPATFALAALLLVPTLAAAGEAPLRVRSDHETLIRGGEAPAAFTSVDTVTVLGGPGTLAGRFEDPAGQPDWHGWTSVDYTTSGTESYWHVSDFQAITGAYSYWCGTWFDDDPGYGNGWNQSIVFTETVADPGQQSIVRWAANVRVDTEPGYDYVWLEYNAAGAWEVLARWDGEATYPFDETWPIFPGEYAGEADDEIQLRIRVTSDPAWSDEDDLWDTDGACQVDDIVVEVDGQPVDVEDFEDQDPGRWQSVVLPGVGDFAHIWTDLQDLDPCVQNRSPQVAFIDDGEVVPGTGGTTCVTWCYGPGGYTVNFTGGLAGPDFTLDNGIESPVIAWPAGHAGGLLAFDVYQHNELLPMQAPICHTWGVRSTADPVADPIEEQDWQNDGYVYFGPPSYAREEFDLTAHLVPGCVQVQVQLKTWQIPTFYWIDESTPAPYFDNVRVQAFPVDGPLVTVKPAHLPQDAFPASGQLDLDDLASNSVRFDMARNVAPDEHAHIDPGDSIVVRVASREAGWTVASPPLLQVRMRANPVFAGVRTLPPGFQQTGDLVVGAVTADTVWVQPGVPLVEHWCVDLPDTGFFYPGDVIHCYVEASEQGGGEFRTATLPADTVGFSDFGLHTPFDRRFVVRALPSLHSDTPGDQPPVLMWHDSGDGRTIMRWHHALLQAGFAPGHDLDVFTTRSPSSALGNGLGGRATAVQLDAYETIVYSCGDLAQDLLADGSPGGDPSPDLQLIDHWLAAGDRQLLLTGDNLVSGLSASGALGDQFVTGVIGAELVSDDLAPWIANQVAPTALPLPGNPVIVDHRWLAYGDCPDIARFDAILPADQAVRLAEYADLAGNPGVFPYAAALLHETTHGNRVVTLPYDLASVRATPDFDWPPSYAGWPPRAILLDQILTYFGHFWYWPVPAPPAPASLAVSCSPNPFNPRTTLELDLPRTGRVTVRLYDVRGRQVRTLTEGRLTAGRHQITWDGRDGRGRALASGVYFVEVRALQEVRIEKLTLVR